MQQRLGHLKANLALLLGANSGAITAIMPTSLSSPSNNKKHHKKQVILKEKDRCHFVNPVSEKELFRWDEINTQLKLIMKSQPDCNSSMKFSMMAHKNTSGPNGERWMKRRVRCHHQSKNKGGCGWHFHVVCKGDDKDESIVVDAQNRSMAVFHCGKTQMCHIVMCDEDLVFHNAHEVVGKSAHLVKVRRAIDSPSKMNWTPNSFIAKCTEMFKCDHDKIKKQK